MKMILTTVFIFILTLLKTELIYSQEQNQIFRNSINKLNERLLRNEDSTLSKIILFKNLEGKSVVDNSFMDNWLLHDHTFQKWNGVNWINDSNVVFTYNEYSLISEELNKDWIGSQWLEIIKNLYEYNLSQSLEEVKLQYLSGGVWTDSIKSIYAYNSFGQVSTINTYDWYNNSWINYQLMTSTYNNNQLAQVVYQLWDGVGWENVERNVYAYTSNSLSISVSFWTFGTWINVLNLVLNYNQSGYLSETLLQYWDPFGGWENITHLLFSYDQNNNIVEGLWQDWDSGSNSWINYSRTTTTYRSDNIPLSDSTELWSNNNWYINSLWTYEYDGNSNLTQMIYQIWNGTWINDSRQIFLYTITDVDYEEINPSAFVLNQNYPNPFNPSTVISYQLPVSGFVSLKVYDVLGNEVVTLVNEYKPAGSYEVEFSGHSDEGQNLPAGRQGLSSGIYFYQLKANNFIETKKMILLR